MSSRFGENLSLMAHITTDLQYGGAAALGVVSHVVYFIHGTHHGRQSARIALSYLIAETGILILSISALGLRKGAIHAVLLSSAYAAALFASIVSYRLLFHRIRQFPGPLAAKTTKLYAAYLNRNGKMHVEHLALSEKYGDFVRVGPNELMIRHVDAIAAVHGAQSRCTKGPVYDNLEFMGEFNLDGMQDRESHRWRRQIWDRGLGSKSLDVYEKLVRETARDWLAKLAEYAAEDKSVDISLFSLLIAFENMGRVGFSKIWGGVKAGKESRLLYLIEFLFGQIAALGSSLNWPVPLAKAVNLDTRQAEFETLVIKTTDERLERTDDPEDIMKYMVEDFRAEEPKSFFNKTILCADASAIFIGATDTVGATMTFLFFHLAKDPQLQQQIREALSPLAEKSSEFSNSDLSGTDLLEAVINEILRLYPAAASNGARYSPPEGLEIAGVFIPGGVEMFLPVYSYHRDERYFKSPNEFLPERWTTRPDLILDKRAFHPFLTGPWNCVGRRLALMLLRIVVAYTVWNFEFEFAPGEDGTALTRDLVNQIILKTGPLHLRFKQIR